MSLVNLQIKVYPEAEALFNSLMAESDCTTKGKFMDLLLENFQNPRIKTVEKDTPATFEKIRKIEDDRNRLQNIVTELENELLTHREQQQVLEQAAGEFLIICKRDGYAKTYPELFRFMLKILQSGNAFILDARDKAYIAQFKNDNENGQY